MTLDSMWFVMVLGSPPPKFPGPLHGPPSPYDTRSLVVFHGPWHPLANTLSKQLIINTLIQNLFNLALIGSPWTRGTLWAKTIRGPCHFLAVATSYTVYHHGSGHFCPLFISILVTGHGQ